jgi:hypothetical protein
MQLRSGRTTNITGTLRRDSRNLDEFAERRRYQQERNHQYQEQQKRIEESIYDEVDKDAILNNKNLLERKIKTILNKTRHLIYLNHYQKEKNHSFSQKIKTIMEVYELYRYNIDYIIEYFNNHKKDKRLARALYDKGLDIRVEMHKNSLKRTRSENKLYYECDELIKFVTHMLHYYILDPRN